MLPAVLMHIAVQICTCPVLHSHAAVGAALNASYQHLSKSAGGGPMIWLMCSQRRWGRRVHGTARMQTPCFRSFASLRTDSPGKLCAAQLTVA